MFIISVHRSPENLGDGYEVAQQDPHQEAKRRQLPDLCPGAGYQTKPQMSRGQGHGWGTLDLGLLDDHLFRGHGMGWPLPHDTFTWPSVVVVRGDSPTLMNISLVMKMIKAVVPVA